MLARCTARLAMRSRLAQCGARSLGSTAIDKLRNEFPALLTHEPAIIVDGPGGTQVHETVIEAMVRQITMHNSNVGGNFTASEGVLDMFSEARSTAATFLNAASSSEVQFGPNMTSLTSHLARSLAHTLSAGDEIVLSRMCHEANVSPWLKIAEERGATVRWIQVNPETFQLDLDSLEGQLSSKTRLLSLGYAANLIGTINDVKRAVRMAQSVGAMTFVDAVHYAPHGLIDVQDLDCDFLACSPYKFFGPHTGMLYGKANILESLPAYRVRPCEDALPSRETYQVSKWEMGTQNYEGIAGATAAMKYIASIGARFNPPEEAGMREELVAAWELIGRHEAELTKSFVEGIQSIPGITLYGIQDPDKLSLRTPTFAFRKAGLEPEALTEKLTDKDVWCCYGNFYAQELSTLLGLEDSGYVTRLGFMHYNSLEEVQRVLDAIDVA